MAAMAMLMMLAVPAMAPADMTHTAAPCPAKPAPLPAGLAGWRQMAPLAAGADAARAPLLTPGAGAKAMLPASGAVTWAIPPQKPATASDHGGLFAFVAPRLGRYRVALGAAAWIDVVQAGKAMPSIAHGHGPDCSGVRKMVDFDLPAGRYLLQVSAAAGASLPLMVAIIPADAPR